MDVVRASYPAFPTTQPLAVPLDLSQAARIVLKDPLYLGRIRGDLWITRSDALPLDRVLRDAVDPKAADPQSHVIDRRVLFVHWMPDDSGVWPPYLVCPGKDGPEEVIWQKGHATLPVKRDFKWDHAYSWNEKVVVPSAKGISVFTFGPQIKESYQWLISDADGKPSDSVPQALLADAESLLAWAPWEHGVGSHGAQRYVDGKGWSPLGPEQNWPEKIAYLVPLLDTTVFQFVSDDKGDITVENTNLGTGNTDEAAVKKEAEVRKLVEQLGEIDEDARHDAYKKLADFGPGIWPLLEKLQRDQPPQSRMLIGQLLKDKNHPTLSGMSLQGNRRMRLISRLSDGGVVLYAEQGVSIPEGEDQTTTIAPAWLSVRPGHYVELLSPLLVHDLKPDTAQFEVVADQWLVNSDIHGPRLFYGNGLATLLRKDDQAFTQVIGMDQMGRWLFRKPQDAIAAAPTLVIDPHLPDPTPRLPVWQLAIAETVGWNKDNWPAFKNGTIYALTASDWVPLENDKEFFTSLDQPAASTTQPNPASRPSVDAPILITKDGSKFFGGESDLTMLDKNGKTSTWKLPDIANGAGPVFLIEARDGKLFLFNQPGRVLRIARTPGAPEPFKLEVTFTHNIPSARNPTRIWVDPAGRIDIAFGARLAVLFPAGYIPAPIMQKMADKSGLDVEGL